VQFCWAVMGTWVRGAVVLGLGFAFGFACSLGVGVSRDLVIGMLRRCGMISGIGIVIVGMGVEVGG
jgi:hypothetical protein